MGNRRKTAKEKIVEAAWELFMEQGYEDTTLQEIIEKSGTSKGAFYHHFRAKEDLLFRMAMYFDRDYDNWLEKQDPERPALEKLHDYLMYTSEAVEKSKFKPFLAQLYGYEVMTEGTRYIKDETRQYFRILYALFREAVKRGEVRTDRSAQDYARTVAGMQRGLTYEWLLSQCQYSLADTVDEMATAYLSYIKS